MATVSGQNNLVSSYHMEITLELDYCNGLFLKTVWKLEMTLNVAVQLLKKVDKADPVSSALSSLHIN